MNYNVEDLDQSFWEAMMDAFWDYSDQPDRWHMYYNMAASNEFCKVYCGI